MNQLKTKLLIVASLCLGLVGIVQAEEVIADTAPAVEVSGQFSTDFTLSESMTMTTPYTGLQLSGDQWLLSTSLSENEDGSLSVGLEEAKYSWNVTDMIAVTFGRQAEPFGIAWGLHRPADNWFVSTPREHMTQDGVGLAVKTGFGLGVNALYGNAMEEGEDNYWGLRVAYGLSMETQKVSVGLSLNNNEAMLIDVTNSGTVLGLPYELEFEYDMTDDGDDTTDNTYWLRGMVAPEFAKGAFVILGMNSDDDDNLIYGIGYKCSEKTFITSELSGDGDTMFRVSYTF